MFVGYIYSWSTAFIWPCVFVHIGGVGWGGACANVHVNLLGKWTRVCVCRYVRVDMGGVGWGGVGWGGVGHVLTFM